MIDLTADDTSDSEEESYQCKTCGKSYSELNELLTHTLAHSAQLTEDKSETVTGTIGTPVDGRGPCTSGVTSTQCDALLDLTDNASSSQVHTETGEQPGRDSVNVVRSGFPRKGQGGINLPKQTSTEAFTVAVPKPSIKHTAEGPREGLTYVVDLTKVFPVSFYGVSNLSEKSFAQTLSYSHPKGGPTLENQPPQEKPQSSFDVGGSNRVDACTPDPQVPRETHKLVSAYPSKINSSQTSMYSNQQDLDGPAEQVPQATFDQNDRIDECTPTAKDPSETYTGLSDAVLLGTDDGSTMMPLDTADGSAMVVEDEDTGSGALVIDEADSSSNGVTLHNNVNNPAQDLPYKCKECNKSFALQPQLVYHSKVHSTEFGVTCPVCMKVCKSVSGLMTHVQMHAELSPHCCSVCGDTFKTRPVLKRHMLVHSDARPYECKICGVRFKQGKNLKKHQKVHCDEGSHKCGVCGLGFDLQVKLDRHMKMHRPHVCVICGAGFRTESILALHNESHRVEMSYHSQNTPGSVSSPQVSDSSSLQEQADVSSELSLGVIAPTDFSDSTISSNSSESTNKNVKEKPHREPKEEISKFDSSVKVKVESIKAEKNLHSEKDTSIVQSDPLDHPTSCHVCGMVFVVREYLMKHLEMHTKSQTLDCVVYDKKDFKSKDKLKAHMVTHSDVRPYKCKICGTKCKRPADLKKHVALHSDDKPYKCVICQEAFKTSSSKAAHVRTHIVEGSKNARNLLKSTADKYPSPDNYLSEPCDEQIDWDASNSSNTSSIKSENMCRNVKEEAQRCHVVERIVSGGKNDTSIIHTNMFAQGHEAAITMKDMINLPSQSEIESLLDNDSKDETASTNVHCHAENNTEVPSQSRTLPYKCGSCDKSFLKFHQLSFHSRTHKDKSPVKCDVCGMAFAVRDSLKKHLEMHTEDQTIECVVCGKKGFPSKYKLEQHMVTHSDVRPYKCNICGKTFKRPQDLRSHAILHSDDRPYKCVICRKGFKSTSGRASHLRSHLIERGRNTGNSSRPANNQSRRLGETDNEVTQNISTTSGQPSTTSADMDRLVIDEQRESHAAVSSGKSDPDMTTAKTTSGNVPQEDGENVSHHSRTLPYKCRSCEMSFLQFYQLSAHSRTHSFDNPVKCDLCGEVVDESLQKHLELHCKKKLPTCSDCGKVFMKKFQLKQHMAVHSDARPYKCKICGKDFKRRIELKAHVAIHSDDRPLKCVICRKGFKTYSERSSHLRSHTVKNNYH